MNRISDRDRVSRRSGYTLVEVLLALALSGLLMLVVHAAMQSYWQLSTLGRIDTERGQLARTLIRRMEMDIRSLTFTPPEQEIEEDSGEQAADEGAGNTASGSSTEANPRSDSTTIQEDDSNLIANVHLIGTAQALDMIVLRPTRNRTGSLEDEIFIESQSDRRKVGYVFSAGGELGPPGLYYRNVDQQLESMQEQEGSTSLSASGQYELLAAEVEDLRFQYFDGVSNTWVDAWHSRDMASLPRALKNHDPVSFRRDVLIPTC